MISVDKLSAKALQRFATCLLVTNNLCGKLVSSLELPIIFDDNLKTISVSFFIADFNFSFYIDKNEIIIHYIYNNFKAPCEKSKIVSFASSITKHIVVFRALSKFAVKLIF